MERMNRALRWLAVVALIVGLANAFLQAMLWNEQAQTVGYESSGLSGSFPTWMFLLTSPALDSLAYLLAGGVAVLGMVFAWVNQRRGWLALVLVVTLASILWPEAYQFWNIVHPSLTQPPTSVGDGPSFSAELNTFSIYVSPLAPVILILVLSAFSRAGMRAAEDTRLASDAALEITRSPL